MGERLLCKQEVVGSIPITSTTARTLQSSVRRKAQQRLRSNRESAPRGAREIDRETEFAPGLRPLRV